MSKDVTEMMMPVPSNLSAGRAVMVDKDLYNICERIKEVDPRLALVYHHDHERPWVVMERGLDNTDRFVSRYKELGAHILDDLRYMRNVPFEKRLEELEKKIAKENESKTGIEGEAFDRFAWEFRKAAKDANMIDPVWDRSYRNVKAAKKDGKKNGAN